MPAITLAAFGDVPSSHPNVEAIEYAQEQGIVQGYADGSFKPGKSISRSEFTKIIVAAALGYDPANDPAGANVFTLQGLIFTDVKKGEWYVPYVRKAVQALIVSGYPDGTFRPEQTINFAEASKIIVRSFGIDTHEDTVWYRPYVRALGARSAIPTSIASLDAPVTRGEMAEMVYRLREHVQDKSSRTYEDVAGENATEEPGRGVYLDFDDRIIGNGKSAVLFFHADWCPICRAQDGELKRWYSTQEFPLSTYKIDYDSHAALRTKYGITTQHTFVLIDGQGNAIRTVTDPTDTELIDLLTAE